MRFISRAVVFFIMIFAGTHLCYAEVDAEKNNMAKEQALNVTSPPSHPGEPVPKAPPNATVETKIIDGNDQLKDFKKAKKQPD